MFVRTRVSYTRRNARAPAWRLENNLDGELHLPRITDTSPEEAVEVEQRRRAERVDVVLVVERVEHLEDRDDLHAAALEAEWTREAPVEGEERVVLAVAVAATIHTVQRARARGNGLGAARLDARVGVQAGRQREIAVGVELVPDVTIRGPPVLLEIEEVEAAIGERIPLVRVVVLVFREHVVRLELVTLGEAFADAERKPAIARLAEAVCHHDLAEEWIPGTETVRVTVPGARAVAAARAGRPVVVEEAGQVASFGPRDVHVSGPLLLQLLLVGRVVGVDARVLVVAVEHPDAAEERELSRRHGSHRQHAGPGGRRRAERGQKARVHEDRLLLHAVGRDRADLREHVLARRID